MRRRTRRRARSCWRRGWRSCKAIRAGAAWLNARPQLGWAVFARGAAEDLTETDRSKLKLEVPALLAAYLAARRRAARAGASTGRSRWCSSRRRDALARLRRLLGSLPDWCVLEQFLPEGLADGLPRRAALSATLLAGLELARDGQVALLQEHSFGPIRLRDTRGGSGA